MRLVDCLQQQSLAIHQLLALLEDERGMLAAVAVDGHRLQEVAKAKQTQLERLETLEAERRELQARLGYGVDRDGSQQAATVSGCLDAWLALMGMAERVARLNATNGELLKLRMAHNQRILNLISEARGNSLYDQQGRARSGGGQLNIEA